MTYIKLAHKTLNLLGYIFENLPVTLLSSATVVLLSAEISNAVVLTFDDIEPVETYGRVQNKYGGLRWDNFGYVNKSFHPGSGYDKGAVSGKYTAFNWKADTAKVSADDAFNFNGAYLASAWNNKLNVSVEGFSNDTVKYSQTVTVNPNSSSWFGFNYQQVDKLVFKSSGGVDANPTDEDSGKHFVLDDFTFDFAQIGNGNSGNDSEVVPEPITIIGSLVAGSFGAIFYRKSRKSKRQIR